jgi:hypothetical protein
MRELKRFGPKAVVDDALTGNEALKEKWASTR